MASLAEFLWWRLPRAVAGRLPTVGQMLGDGGSWLRAWPQVAVGAPALALALGLLIGLGRTPSAEIFADSIPLFAALTAVSLLGGGLGAAAWLGYVLGDLLFERFWVQANIVDVLVQVRSGQLIVFLVLFVGVVVLPYGITRLARQTVASLPHRLRGGTADAAARAAIGAFIVAGWVTVVPVAVAPFYMWRGIPGPAQTIVDLRRDWLVFVAIAIVAGVARVALERAAQRRAPAVPTDWSVTLPPDPKRTRLGIVAGAFIGTLLLAGMIQTSTDVGVVFGGLLLAGTIRTSLMPRFAGVVALLERIPVMIRILVVAAAAYSLTMVAVTSHQGVIQGDSYLGMLLAIVGAVILAAILLPSDPAIAAFADIPSDGVATPPPLPAVAPIKALGLPVLLSVLGALLLPEITRADDCSGAFDCFQTMSAGALAAAAAGGVGGILYALYGKGGALNRERERLAAEHAERSANRSEPSSRPSEPAPKPASVRKPDRLKVTHGDGSREEFTRDKSGKVDWYHFGAPYVEQDGDRLIHHPAGEVEHRVEITPGGSSTTFGPNNEVLERERVNPDGTTYRLTPDASGGGSMDLYDADGNLKASGRYFPDGSATLNQPTPSGHTTTTLGPDGRPTGWSATKVVGEDTRTEYWDDLPK